MNQRERFTDKLLSFLWKKKWWWGTPMILTLLALGILIQLTELPAPPLGGVK
jgi:hypothetical protein